MGENSNEFLPIAILRNRYAVLIKIKFVTIHVLIFSIKKRERLHFFKGQERL
jgi:hypothetical protein